MKRIAAIVSVAAVLVAAAASMNLFSKTMITAPKDKEGHELSSLWQEYRTAEAADRPARQTEILSRIKVQATQKGLALDFWDAARLFVEVSGRRNWKLGDSLSLALKAEAMAFPDPIVGFAYLRRYSPMLDMYTYAKDHESVLSRSRNVGFYKEDSRISESLGGVIPDYVESDYEYALWTISLGPSSEVREQATEQLRTIIADSYPRLPYLEYRIAGRLQGGTSEWKDAMQAIADMYPGKAVSLYPQAAILAHRLNLMQDDRNATVAQFRVLREDAASLERSRRSFKGSEAAMLEGLDTFDRIIRTLDGKSVELQLVPEQATVLLRNTSQGWIKMVSTDDPDKVLFRQNFSNATGSYYVYDTVRVALPDVGDGRFRVSVGSDEIVKGDDELSGKTFSRYSYALSLRRSAGGYGFFAANASTGMPLETVGLIALQDGKEHSLTLCQGDRGYTEIPAIEGVDLESDFSVYVKGKDASGFVRMSPTASSSGLYLPGSRDYFGGGLYLNTGAVRTGDAIKFKGLVYKCLDGKSMRVEPLGAKASVTICNPSGEECFSGDYDLSDMGSFAGEFTPAAEAESGVWSISLRYGQSHVAYKNFYYGDFVLPGYTCEIAPFEDAVFPGDTVHVKGRLRSFSGHNLSEASVTYAVTNRYGNTAVTGDVEPSPEGHFDFAFKAEYGWYVVELKVTDASGETQAFSTGLTVSDNMYIHASPVGYSDDYESDRCVVFTGGEARFNVNVMSSSRPVRGAGYSYELFDSRENKVLSGEGSAGTELLLGLSSCPDGCYRLKVQSRRGNPTGPVPTADAEFIKYTQGEPLPADVGPVFRKGAEVIAAGGDICFDLGSGTHPIWAAAELYSPEGVVLWSKRVFVAKGTFDAFSIPYPDEFGSNVCLGILFFNDYEASCFQRNYCRAEVDHALPLAVTSFRDEAAPGQEVTVEIETLAGVEAVASVWDKASDAIMRNGWDRIYVPSVLAFCAPHVESVRRPGVVYDFYRRYSSVTEALSGMTPGISSEASGIIMAKSSNAVLYESAESVSADLSAEEETDDAAELPDVSAMDIRSDFSAALAFEPFLRSDEDGRMRMQFRTSDKLSTFNLAVFAHDANLRNNLTEKEFTVTLPVKVDVLRPEFLVSGDDFTLTATVSSASGNDLSGRLIVYRYDGDDYKNLEPVSAQQAGVTVPSGGTVSHQFEISPVGDSPIGILVSFVSDDGKSDSMFFSIPVLERAQTLTESHSAVLLSGADKDGLVRDLESRFTGTSHYGAVCSEITVLDMVRQTLEGKLRESGNDVLSLTEDLYVRTVLNDLGTDAVKFRTDTLVDKIFNLQNADGGFAWFKGYGSSPVLTAVVLERFRLMGSLPEWKDKVSGHLSDAVKYLDLSYFSESLPLWRGGVSEAQYMYVRSLYADVPFDVPAAKSAARRFSEFRKSAKDYLVPDKTRGLSGNIMGKVRRLNTLRALLASESGLLLARQWGIKSSSKLSASASADVASLLEYAVCHRDGGWYYPNAVMPWRGLLETEAYAHAQIAALLSSVDCPDLDLPSPGDIADGIRLWLMLQKETQHWDLTPHFADAVACILSGSREVLDTKVITLTKTYRRPLEEIAASGNGFTVSRHLCKEVASADGRKKRVDVSAGDLLIKGDKIIAVFRIHNAENRSFVRLRAPREAALRPVNQLSGYSWDGYREVRTAYTDWFFDSMPEEDIEIVEEYFVTQTGVFACGVPEIESLYANHYRANGAFAGSISAK